MSLSKSAERLPTITDERKVDTRHSITKVRLHEKISPLANYVDIPDMSIGINFWYVMVYVMVYVIICKEISQ